MPMYTTVRNWSDWRKKDILEELKHYHEGLRMEFWVN